MNQEQIEELRKLAQAATPGPWVAGGPSFGAPFPVWCDEVVTESGVLIPIFAGKGYNSIEKYSKYLGCCPC